MSTSIYLVASVHALHDFVLQHDIESLDPRGRTPLHLAVTLGRIKCVETLLHHNANSLALNRHHWAGKMFNKEL